MKIILKTSFIVFFTLLSFNSKAQSIDYGTYTIYKNPKHVQLFTNEKFEEIKQKIEEKRSDYKQVVWNISEYTYVIIEPRYTTMQSTNTDDK